MNRDNLGALAKAALDYGEIPNNRDLQFRAARIAALERREEVLNATLRILRATLADPARMRDTNVYPDKLAAQVATEQGILDEIEGDLLRERDDAGRAGFASLTAVGGAREVIAAVFWRGIEKQAREYLDACDHPGSPKRVEVESFVRQMGNVEADLNEGHGVAQSMIVSRLLEGKGEPWTQ